MDPLYYRWAVQPSDGTVLLAHNGEDHPARVRSHGDLARAINEPRVHHGYASRMVGGWRLTDYEHKPVRDPYVTRQVMRALGEEETPPLPEPGGDYTRTHHGRPLPVTAAATRSQLLEEAMAHEQEFGPDRSAVLDTLPNGWTIRQPMTYADLHREGKLMDNCLQNTEHGWTYDEGNRQWHTPYGPSEWGPPARDELWAYLPDSDDNYQSALDWPHARSLRDPDNLPHVSFFHHGPNEQGHSLRDIYGRHNSDPKDEYRQMIGSWARTLPGQVAVHTSKGSMPIEQWAPQTHIAREVTTSETRNQELRRWQALQTPQGWTPEHTFDNGWQIRTHQDPESIQRVGEFMRNCWRGVIPDFLPGQTREGWKYHALHDEDGIPRVAFFTQDNPHTNEPPALLSALGMRNTRVQPEHAAALREWADAKGITYPGYLRNW